MITRAYEQFKQKNSDIVSEITQSIKDIKQKKIITSDHLDDYSRLIYSLNSVLKNNDKIDNDNILRKKIYDFYQNQSKCTKKIKNTENITLDKVYFISLNPNSITCKKKLLHLNSLFGDRLEIFNAVDSRDENKFIYKEFDLKLNPLSEEFEMNFSTSYGAVGCYLSHYSIYKKVLEENYDHVLVLEDDIDIKNLDKLSDQVLVPEDVEFIQLNSRAVDSENYNYLFCETVVDGTESYIITKSGAKKMLDATYSLKDTNIKNYFSFLSWISHDEGTDTYNTDLMYQSTEDSVNSINSIRAPIDKFLHLICSNFVNPNLRMKSFAIPLLKLDESHLHSTVLSSIPHWEYSAEEISNFETICETYKWWESDL